VLGPRQELSLSLLSLLLWRSSVQNRNDTERIRRQSRVKYGGGEGMADDIEPNHRRSVFAFCRGEGESGGGGRGGRSAGRGNLTVFRRFSREREWCRGRLPETRGTSRRTTQPRRRDATGQVREERVQ